MLESIKKEYTVYDQDYVKTLGEKVSMCVMYDVKNV